jgi:predicted cation transporter
MSEGKIVFLLMGLLISGGMLIPGNIPNIICASKLGIKSREWAVFAAPLGAVLMLVYFAVLMLAIGN